MISCKLVSHTYNLVHKMTICDQIISEYYVLPFTAASSIRRLTIPQVVVNLLSDFRGGATDGRIFNLHYSTPRHWLRKAIKKYNEANDDKLPDINFHGLRHTNATLLISQGVDIRTVSGRLGHNSPNTTLNVYSHFLKSRDEAASNALEELLEKK